MLENCKLTKTLIWSALNLTHMQMYIDVTCLPAADYNNIVW